MTHIKLTKVSEKKEGYDEGYFVLGRYASPPEVGKVFNVWRYNRNGVEVDGLFSTSPIVSIEGNLIQTKNSTYKIEPIDD